MKQFLAEEIETAKIMEWVLQCNIYNSLPFAESGEWQIRFPYKYFIDTGRLDENRKDR